MPNAMAKNPTIPESPAPKRPAAALDQAVDLIAAALRGGPLDAGGLAKNGRLDGFLETLDAHEVAPLLHHGLKSRGAAETWPDDIRTALAEAFRVEAAREAIRVEETRRVLAALDAEGVVPLVLKGTAFAYTLYPLPHLRPREDTSLLVRQAAVAEGVRILGELGYRRFEPPPGERVLRQDTYLRDDDSGFTHALKLHWAISSVSALADNLDYAELRQRAVAIEALSPCALGLCHEDSLLHACLHRRPRSYEKNLLSLYDVHLLVGSMTPVEFSRFARAALDKRLGIAARDAIAHTQAKFHTELPFGTLDDHFPEAKLAEEARYRSAVTPGWRRLHNLVYDIRGIERLREKLAWAFEHAFPPSAYMRERYGADSSDWLPALYIRRGLKSVAALLRRSN
ncbi:MAG: nucleotidyltransferase family protein [Gammaproteobacteria bacterium]|nr:nucleotidyltransferase family protein [Gammaproteobacteria bacterium]